MKSNPPNSPVPKSSSQTYRDLLLKRIKELESKASSEQDKESIRQNLLKLICLDNREERTPVDAIEAMVASSFMGISTPEWAVVMLAKVSNDRLLGKIQGLDKAFGFVGENNHTPDIKKRAYRQRDEMLMMDIFRLQLLNFSIDQACEMVAKKVLISRKWNQTCYELGFNATEPDSLKSTLRDKYYKEGWKRLFGKISENIVQSSRQHLLKNEANVLASFERPYQAI